MLGRLLKFEASLHFRTIGFWLTFVIMFAIGLATSNDAISLSFSNGAKLKSNGAIPVAGSMGVMSLFCLFFAAVFTVTGVMRDDTYKTTEVIHATPVSTFNMVASRMIGVWMITFFAVMGTVIGLAVAGLMPWADSESYQSFNLWHYLHPVIFFVALNTLFVSSLFMLIAAVTRNKALVYVSAIGIFAIYFGLSAALGTEADDWVLSMTDPFGVSAMTVMTEFWPAAEQNSRTVPLSSYFLVNRLFWGAVSLGLFVASFRLFSRGLVTRKTKRSKAEIESETGKIIVTSVTPNTGRGYGWAVFAARFKMEYMTIIKSIPFIVLLAIALMIYGLAAWSTLFFTANASLPTNPLMAGLALGSFGLTLLIIMVFFGGDLVWRERTTGINEIIDGTPAPNASLMLPKWLALAAMIATIISLALVAAMITQVVISDIPLNIGTYLKIGFLSFGVAMIFDIVLVMFAQSLLPNRIIGMLGAAALVIGSGFLGLLPFYHPLMGYGAVSPGSYSEINGYGSMINFRWFLIYWGGFAVMLTVLAIWLWRRGLQSGIGARLSGLRRRVTPVTGGIFAAAFITFIGSGGVIFKAWNIDNTFRFQKEREMRSVNYEKLVDPLTEVAVPKIRSVTADVQLFPSRQDAVISGTYVIENSTDAPLTTLYIELVTSHEEDRRVLNIDGAVADTTSDDVAALEDFGIRRFTFDPALPVGATTGMQFETYFHPPRLGDGSSILKNGTFVNNFVTMPQLGISKNYLRNANKRRKYDLPELEKAADRDDMEARQRHYISQSSDYVDFAATICTDVGQIPIAPGKLRREYTEGDRACREYKAINPILNFFSFLSADYAVLEDVWNNPNGDDVDINIYYHPAHDYNVELMMDAVKASLTSFTTRFGPYQYAQVRIMEFPSGNFAQAFAGTIPFSENVGFTRNPGKADDVKSLDIATWITMHELAHQWFAHQIVAADTKGSTLLTEGLSEYAAFSAYEEKYGWDKTKALVDKLSIEDYLLRRTVDSNDEPPLALVEDQQYIHYQKASWVFWGLRHYIGNDVMAGAVRQFVTDYGSKGPPYPTTLQLIDYLREAAGPDYDQLITDYFDRITFWELSLGADDPVVTTKDGQTELSFTITLDKLIASEKDGKETSVTEIEGEALNEWVEIGFYDTDPAERNGGGWTRLERVKLTEAETTLSYSFDTAPTHMLLDPRRLLLERAVGDNGKEIDAPESAASVETQSGNADG